MYCHFYDPITKAGFFKDEDFIGESLVDRANNYGDNEWSYSSGGETRYAISMETQISGETRTVGSWLIFRKDADGFWRIEFF